MTILRVRPDARLVFRRLTIAALALATCLVVTGPRIEAQDTPSPSRALDVAAGFDTRGSSDEAWFLTATPDGAVFLHVYYPQGEMLARFTTPASYIARVQQAVDDERFFELPRELTPRQAPFNRPQFWLEIRSGDKFHQVTLFDPASVKDDLRVQRFLRVFGSVYQGLPQKPSW
jgi:hypothetical protein